MRGQTHVAIARSGDRPQGCGSPRACFAGHTAVVIGEDFAGVLARAQEGDEEAFAMLWRDLNPALLRYLGVNGEAAEDVASDTWATVVKGLRRFTGDESAWRGWVFVTARRRAIDAGRRRSRAAQLEHDLASLPAETQAVDPADVVAASHDTDAALRLVAQLSPLQAEVITLRVLTGLSSEEVAKIVHRSPGAVRVAAHRGLRRLEEILATQGVTPARSETL